MIGTQFIKGSIDWEEYARVADWCNENNATIVEYDDYYAVEALPETSENVENTEEESKEKSTEEKNSDE